MALSDFQKQYLAASMLMNGQQQVRPGKAGRIDAFSNMVRNLAGAYMQSRAMGNESAANQQASSMLGGYDPNDPASLQAMLNSDNPVARDYGRKIQLARAMSSPKQDVETFGTSPQTVMGPDGKPALVQMGNQGTVRPVQGYSPVTQQQKTLTEGGFYRDPGGQWQPIPGYQDQAMQRAKASGTNVTVSPTSVYNAGAGAASKPFYEAVAKDATDIYGAADAAQQNAQQIGQLNKVLGDMDTGYTTEGWASFLKAARSVGIDVGKDTVATVENANMISGQMVMQQLNAMKGPATEKEREYLQQINPSTSTTPQGRQQAAYIAEWQAKRLRETASRIQAEVEDPIASGQITSGQARQRIAQIRRETDAKYDASFSPPKSQASASAATGVAAAPYQQSPTGASGSWGGAPASDDAGPWNDF